MRSDVIVASTLHSKHAEHLARFRISREMLEAAGVRSVTDVNAREELGLSGNRGVDLGGVMFPYYSPATGERTGGRIRLDLPLSGGSKYLSEPGCRNFFFPPGVTDLLHDLTALAVVVEAEKSALALTALAARSGRKLLVIAIGGCWGWRRGIGKRPLPDGNHEPETGPGPDFDLITWQGRSVTLAFDSNAATNSGVRKARRVLAQELAGRGATVLIADVPSIEGVNGPDDLVAISGDESSLLMLDNARLFALCAVAEADQAIADLEVDKKSDPLLAIEAIAAVGDAARRGLLIAKLAALRNPGVNRAFIRNQVANHNAEVEADRRKATEACRRARLMAMHVEGATLLDEICVFIRRFVLVSEFQLRIAALWIVHTHVFGAAECTPYLAISSPEKRSGKTRFLEVLSTLAANTWFTGRVTAAVLYRKIDAESSTLLLDESDAAFNSGDEYSEALRGILNTGHRRGGKATSCVKQGATISYQDFSTFSPKAIAGIGKLPDTVMDRSIPFNLMRKMRSDRVDRFRLRDVKSETEQLSEGLEAWGCQSIEKLRDARPELPEELSDRQQDGAEPLLAIADLAGREWPELARRALVSLCCGAQAVDDSNGTLLLSDIRQIFKALKTDRLPSAELVTALTEIETSPWGEWNNGKPITPSKLARLLRPFDISPSNIRIGSKILKGYEAASFEDVWTRYVAPERNTAISSPCSVSATPLQANADAVSRGSEDATQTEGVAGRTVTKTFENAPCSGVAPSETHTRPSTGEISEVL
jgi:hypothetical protein